MPAIIETDCKEVAAIEKLFHDGQINGDSALSKLTFVGPYISERASNLPPNFLGLGAAPKITTISDLIENASSARTKTNVDKLLEYCTYNRRRNTCVKQSNNNKPDYHVPDVNVCGYNSLLAVLKYAHVHHDIPELPDNYNLINATKLDPRNRGTSGGSRYCTCIEHEHTCMAHNEECMWNGTHSTCQPRSIGSQPGFKGPRRRNNHHLSQHLRNADDTEKDGKVYKGNWQQPTQEAGDPEEEPDEEEEEPDEEEPHEDEEEPDENNEPEAEPEEDDGKYRTRYGRQVRKPSRFQGGAEVNLFTVQDLKWLDKNLRLMETFQGGKASDGRRFRNFVHLTSF
jgi:hypothetical protein